MKNAVTPILVTPKIQNIMTDNCKFMFKTL